MELLLGWLFTMFISMTIIVAVAITDGIITRAVKSRLKSKDKDWVKDKRTGAKLYRIL